MFVKNLHLLFYKMRSIILLFIVFTVQYIFAQPIEPENYKKYSGACLSSALFYNPGTYVFKAKACNTTGTIFCAFLTDFEVSNSLDYLKHIELGFELVGHNIHSIKCVAVLKGQKYYIRDFPLGFDASADYHIYTIVQQKNAVKWLVDGKLIWSLSPDIATQLLKPMRLFVNFRPAVSHCDSADGWGCIRKAILPATSFIKQFKYIKDQKNLTIRNSKFKTFSKNKIKDTFTTLNTSLWQFSITDLIKGNKPLYKIENLIVGDQGLKMKVNRE